MSRILLNMSSIIQSEENIVNSYSDLDLAQFEHA